jgi:hypothetical protein
LSWLKINQRLGIVFFFLLFFNISNWQTCYFTLRSHDRDGVRPTSTSRPHWSIRITTPTPTIWTHPLRYVFSPFLIFLFVKLYDVVCWTLTIYQYQPINVVFESQNTDFVCRKKNHPVAV